MRRTPISFLVAGLLAGSTALAHHGFSGRYDVSIPIYLRGVVEAAYFGLPHTEITLTIDPSAGAPELAGTGAEFNDGLVPWSAELGKRVEIEFPPVARFFDLDGRVSIGDTVAVVVLRNCEPPHQLRGQWIAPEAGEPVVRSGRMQSEIGGC